MGTPHENRSHRYELIVELARGGMAELFYARIHGPGGFAKSVAIKRILPHLAGDPLFKQMFLEESRIAARLAHPNVCQVFELVEDADELYLSMEYLDGVSWEHLLAAAPRDHVLRVACGVLAQAAEGLHYAHTLRDVDGTPLPVVHRDVSPHNLFVTVDGVCKLLDFGVAKMMTDGPRTKSGVIKGKLPYMAPEQIRGEAVDGRADVFSLGVCAWEALAGARLFDRATDFLIWKAITEEPIPALRSRFPACPPALDSLVARALDRDPSERPSSARAFATELRAAVDVAGSSELADAVRGWCGERIAARAKRIATAVRGEAADTHVDAAATASMALRKRSIVVLHDEPDAAATVDLVSRARDVDDGPLRPARHAWWPILAAAVLAAALTAVVVVFATRPPSRAEPAASAPRPVATQPAAAPADAAPAPPPPAPAAPAVAAPVRATKPLVRSKTTSHAPAPPPEPASTGTGTLSVRSKPYATIYADGSLLGDTPLYRVQLPAGTHHIRAVLPDGRERAFDVTVRTGEDSNAGTLSW